MRRVVILEMGGSYFNSCYLILNTYLQPIVAYLLKYKLNLQNIKTNYELQHLKTSGDARLE